MKIKTRVPKYHLGENGEFIIENYNFSKPFANFFPGIAGKYGIPMWVFYVNRGQGIISFGTRNKGCSILEFLPANKAWQLVSLEGFRTFIKLSLGNKSILYEPFHNGLLNLDFKLNNRMIITSHNLTLEEENLSLGLSVKVEFFNIPNDNYAGLARIVTIKNLGRTIKKMQILDGLPKIIPFGTSNLFIKNLSRTIEAWMKVENLDKSVPFFKLAVDPKDRPEVIHIEEGHFYLGFIHERNGPKIIKPIVDVDCIFSPVTDFSYPYQFLAKKNFQYPKKQLTSSKTPSGFSLLNLRVSPDQQKNFYSVVGYMRSLDILNSSFKKIIAPGYLLNKSEENKKIIDGLQQDINTNSSSNEFNLYAKQTYLDNILRGGYPVVFRSGDQKNIFYLYARKHGDLERDYNKFTLEPTYFSQGNGNYRDMNQNRRCDVWFNPEIKDDNLTYFFNLLQLDGFNPLVVEGAKFSLNKNIDTKSILKSFFDDKEIPKLLNFLNIPFSPGELVLFIEDNNIKIKSTFDEFLNALLSSSIKIQEAEYQEGYWSDHWTYNLDLLENYLNIYPDELKEIVFKKRVFTYYDNIETVKPRSEKYSLYNGKPRQLHSVARDKAKAEIIGKRTHQPYVVRSECGAGEIYKTTLINKLLNLLINKMASFDPFGTGIEMEANKPNWFDALNGLPALFGSSSCETFELKRLALSIKSMLKQANIRNLQISKEIFDLLYELNKFAQENLESKSPDKDYRYWDKSYSLKEDYRQKVRFGLSGNEIEIASLELNEILDNYLEKINRSIRNAYDKTNKIFYTYFINEVTEFEALRPPYIKPKRFVQKKLPFFLESQMHALRLSDNPDDSKGIYEAVKKSELFDKKLKMYKVTSSLKDMPKEIGRCQIFTPGWLENESIWLHMEYKYLLELLKTGLYEEFYADFKNTFVPFQDPKRYGRSILENSSFLVSSEFPDKNLHGNGFVARLSGSTAEFINIWLIMNAGLKPFFLNDKNELNLKLNPILAGWLFDKKGGYSFNFLGKIKICYHNPKRKNTFGNNAAMPRKLIFRDTAGNPIEIPSDTIPSPYAEQIRSCQIKSIDIFLQ